MKPKSSHSLSLREWLLFLVPLGILSAGTLFFLQERELHKKEQAKQPHRCRYKKVHARLTYEEHYGWFIENNGEEQLIKVAPGREISILDAMDAPVSAKNPNVYPKTRFFGAGKLSICSHEAPQLSEEEKRFTCDHSGPDHRFRNFVLDKWYVQKPFYETRFIGDDPKKIIIRQTLKISDFRKTTLERENIKLTQRDLKRYVR